MEQELQSLMQLSYQLLRVELSRLLVLYLCADLYLWIVLILPDDS